MTPKPTHGGKRPGSGRKPAADEAQVTRSVSMIPAAWELLDEQRGDLSRGTWIHGLALKHDKNTKKKGKRL